MGYTHYWTFNKIKGRAAHQERAYQKAIKECNKVIKSFYKTFGGLSGYSAHADGYGGINVNGKGEEMHEDFILREHFSQNGSDCCKTARKHYDDVVVACLAILKHRLKDGIEVSSDGCRDDWACGVNIASEVLGVKIPNPMAGKD